MRRKETRRLAEPPHGLERGRRLPTTAASGGNTRSQQASHPCRAAVHFKACPKLSDCELAWGGPAHAVRKREGYAGLRSSPRRG